MAILNRIKRLFQADIHAILDVIEEPESVLKQAIREMQENLDQKQGQLARSGRLLDNLQNNQVRLKDEISRIAQDLTRCLETGNEELSRKTIGRRLALEKQLAAVEEQLGALGRQRNEQRSAIEVQQAQLESVLEKARLFVPPSLEEESPYAVAELILDERRNVRRSNFSPHGGARFQVSEEEIELEWIRLQGQGEKGGER